MRAEDCIVTVERRSLGGCLDLAFVFGREFSGPLLRLWLLCAVPACLTVWLLSASLTDMLLPSLIVFLVFGSVFGTLLVACMGPQVFGVPVSVKRALQSVKPRILSWLLLTGILRVFQCLAGVCLVLPSAFVTAWGGHLPEVLILEQSGLRNVSNRLNWLASGGGYHRNLTRVLGLFVFWVVMSVGLFLLMDSAMTLVLNRPVFLARILHPTKSPGTLILQMTHDDPAFLTLFQLALWMPYPLIRLAWFFCYVDQRIRNECWDLQLLFRAEASRLEGSL